MELKQSCLSKNLVYLRKKAGKSQSELAEILHLNRGNIASYESGNAEPSARNLLKIVKYFNIKLEFLLLHDLSVADMSIHGKDPNQENIELFTDEDVQKMMDQSADLLKVVKSQVIYGEYILKKAEDVPQNMLSILQMLFDMAEITKTMAKNSIKMGNRLLNLE